MSPFGGLVLMLVPCLFIAWFASEFQERGWLRLALGAAAIVLSVFVAVVVGAADRFSSNAWFGTASKSLVDATVEGLEAGDQVRVLRALKHLQEKYQPTYENRARYDLLVEETIVEMGRSVPSN